MISLITVNIIIVKSIGLNLIFFKAPLILKILFDKCHHFYTRVINLFLLYTNIFIIVVQSN